jgi:hypothetical protein
MLLDMQGKDILIPEGARIGSLVVAWLNLQRVQKCGSVFALFCTLIEDCKVLIFSYLHGISRTAIRTSCTYT